MRIVLQRVSSANVKIEQRQIGAINKGVVVFLGVGQTDNFDNIKEAIAKILNMRIFTNELGKMDKSLKDIHGGILVISQFTLYGDCSKGNRPSFILSGAPKHAENIYNQFVNYLKENMENVQTGQFGGNMQVELINDGPATFTLEY